MSAKRLTYTWSEGMFPSFHRSEGSGLHCPTREEDVPCQGGDVKILGVLEFDCYWTHSSKLALSRTGGPAEFSCQDLIRNVISVRKV